MNSQAAPQWLPSYIAPFVTLSYPTATPPAPDSFPDASYYEIGILDGCFIITCIAVMAVLRDITRLYISEPFAQWKLMRDLNNVKRANHAFANGAHLIGHANGVQNGHAVNGHASMHVGANGNGHGVSALNGNNKANGNGHVDLTVTGAESRKIHRSVIRFAEQGWSVVYYTTVWFFGLYVHRNLPTKILDQSSVWLNYPNMPLAGPVKFYYLLGTAFYLHQVLILNAEARRKDHWQMMTHHVITVVLMIGSYYYEYTRIGCLIMMLMDWCDIFLPLAKMFRYLAMSTLCDATFTFFMLSWLVTRHALFSLAIKSTIDNGSYIIGLQRNREHPKFVYYTFTSMLVMLQLLQLMWFWMILRVAWKVVSGQGAEDTRSDEDDDAAPESKKDR